MTTKATRNTQAKTSEVPLFMSFELSEKTWKLGFTTGPGQKPRERNMTARDHERVLDEIAQAKHRLGLPETAPILPLQSCKLFFRGWPPLDMHPLERQHSRGQGSPPPA